MPDGSRADRTGAAPGRRMTCPKCEREVYVQPFCPFCQAILIAMWIPEGAAGPIPFRREEAETNG